MSGKITLEQFEEGMKPLLSELQTLNKRRNELYKMFSDLANKVELKSDEDSVEYDDELDGFRDSMFDHASYFINNIDYEYSEVNPGDVRIWAQSTC